jgi:YHS domain-containing protein
MKKIITLLVLLWFANTVWAQEAEIFSTKAGAIRGYDPVAYFKSSKAVKGDKKFAVYYKGANWYFASEENKNEFKAKPSKFEPQYGGYCAYAVSQGYTADTDPDAFAVVDGKLYLNYDEDIAGKWQKKRDEYIKAANANWPKVLKK